MTKIGTFLEFPGTKNRKKGSPELKKKKSHLTFIRGAMEQKKENLKMNQGACSPVLDATPSDRARPSSLCLQNRGWLSSPGPFRQ